MFATPTGGVRSRDTLALPEVMLTDIPEGTVAVAGLVYDGVAVVLLLDEGRRLLGRFMVAHGACVGCWRSADGLEDHIRQADIAARFWLSACCALRRASLVSVDM